jgi:hypothetical protein
MTERLEDNLDTPKTLRYVTDRLDIVKRYGLVEEVIVYSLRAMKENPELTIEQALEAGCYEWDV